MDWQLVASYFTVKSTDSFAVCFRFHNLEQNGENTIYKSGAPFYDGPNGSHFSSILLHNSEFRILNSEFRIPKFALRISEFGIVKYM